MVVRKRTMGSCRRAGSSQWRKLASGRAGSLALSYCALLQSSCREDPLGVEQRSFG